MNMVTAILTDRYGTEQRLTACTNAATARANAASLSERLQRLGYPVKGPFLELGCGYGTMLKAMGEQYPYIKLSGVDLDPAAVKASAESGADVKRGSVDQLPFEDNSFYIVYSSALFDLGRGPEKTFRLADLSKETRRVMKDGGVYYARDGTPLRDWELDDFKKAGLELLYSEKWGLYIFR